MSSTRTRPTAQTTAQKPAEPEAQAPASPPATGLPALVRPQTSSVPGFLQDDIAEYAGAGTSDRREDNLVPFLYVAQKGSPQANERDPAYIKGLKPGMIFDTSTGQMWESEGPDAPGVICVQAHMDSWEVEWGLRGSKDKGYYGRHPIDAPLLSQVREVPKPQGRGVFRMIENGHQLVLTAYHYMILADSLRPVAVPLSSSGLQAHKELNTLLRNKRVRSVNGLVVAPSFATVLRIRTVWRQNDAGDWFQAVFDDCGFVSDDYMDAYAEAKALYKSAMTTGIRVAEPPSDSSDTDESSSVSGSDPDAHPADDSPL